MEYALITGASAGIGKAMAIECANRKFNLLLVALPGEALDETSKTIKQNYPVDVATLGINLTQLDAPQRVFNWVKENHYPVFILINNAGFGGTKHFETADISYIDDMILLNIRALSLLTKLFLPLLKLQQQAYILNVASIATFSPLPFKSTYPASKAFVYSFSRSLYYELLGSNVHVAVIHPGPVMTNPDVIARINQHGKLGKMVQMLPEQVAQIAIRQLLKKRAVIIPGFFTKLNVFLLKYIPLKLRMMLVRKILKYEADTAEKQVNVR